MALIRRHFGQCTGAEREQSALHLCSGFAEALRNREGLLSNANEAALLGVFVDLQQTFLMWNLGNRPRHLLAEAFAPRCQTGEAAAAIEAYRSKSSTVLGKRSNTSLNAPEPKKPRLMSPEKDALDDLDLDPSSDDEVLAFIFVQDDALERFASYGISHPDKAATLVEFLSDTANDDENELKASQSLVHLALVLAAHGHLESARRSIEAALQVFASGGDMEVFDDILEALETATAAGTGLCLQKYLEVLCAESDALLPDDMARLASLAWCIDTNPNLTFARGLMDQLSDLGGFVDDLSAHAKLLPLASLSRQGQMQRIACVLGLLPQLRRDQQTTLSLVLSRLLALQPGACEPLCNDADLATREAVGTLRHACALFAQKTSTKQVQSLLESTLAHLPLYAREEALAMLGDHVANTLLQELKIAPPASSLTLNLPNGRYLTPDGPLMVALAQDSHGIQTSSISRSEDELAEALQRLDPQLDPVAYASNRDEALHLVFSIAAGFLPTAKAQPGVAFFAGHMGGDRGLSRGMHCTSEPPHVSLQDWILPWNRLDRHCLGPLTFSERKGLEHLSRLHQDGKLGALLIDATRHRSTFLQALRTFADDAGIPLIVDETQGLAEHRGILSFGYQRSNTPGASIEPDAVLFGGDWLRVSGLAWVARQKPVLPKRYTGTEARNAITVRALVEQMVGYVTVSASARSLAQSAAILRAMVPTQAAAPRGHRNAPPQPQLEASAFGTIDLVTAARMLQQAAHVWSGGQTEPVCGDNSDFMRDWGLQLLPADDPAYRDITYLLEQLRQAGDLTAEDNDKILTGYLEAMQSMSPDPLRLLGLASTGSDAMEMLADVAQQHAIERAGGPEMLPADAMHHFVVLGGSYVAARGRSAATSWLRNTVPRSDLSENIVETPLVDAPDQEVANDVLEEMRLALREQFARPEIGMVVIEPILVSSGVRMLSRNGASIVQEEADRAGVVIAIDSALSAMRSGLPFGYEYLNALKPTYLMTAKGLECAVFRLGDSVIPPSVEALSASWLSFGAAGIPGPERYHKAAQLLTTIRRQNLIERLRHLRPELIAFLGDHVPLEAVSGIGLLVGFNRGFLGNNAVINLAPAGAHRFRAMPSLRFSSAALQ